MRLNYQATGPEDAPVVLLASSLGTNHAMWAPQLDALSDHFRVVAFDHRGHGASEAPPGPYTIDDLGGDVLELLDELGAEQASYVGISLGGAVGLWLAQNAPDRFHRFALLCPPVNPAANAQTWIDRAAQVRAEGTQSITEATLGRWFLPEYAEAHPDEVDLIRQQLLATPAEGYAACCEALSALDLTPDLGSITAPVLLVTAESDASVPPETVVPLATQIPGAHLEILPGAAHLVTWSHPDTVNPLLLTHLG
ncbi:3-oxoadipate enol-lactonase [Kribbella flavida DSM 17836]|uniref:3-oxoadipate enol-lactonase n=1 Tax=Kribbella flavida (strain DSM 17836 / JCM 10339 / NBRC 14399) TaxID=479435 RepID=D2PUS0_KRIFD|nr:3-oxoadipate enol-lactonase [Kribbella flavida]ADB31386.1 3-oxoadipate enol-lactonase [Kribbella flavida DSM 17836]